MDNKTILAGIKDNDEKIVELVYKKYRNKFIAFAYKKYKLEKEISKGIYQDTFLAFYNNVQSGKLKELTVQLQTYLFQVGKNLVMNYFKNNQKHIRIEPGSYEEDSLHKTAGSEDFEKENRKSKLVQKYLKELSERCLKLLNLFYFEKKPYEEIVEHMEFTNIDSAKTQKYKCMKKLEQLMTEEYNQILNYD